jgi:hypothetical protein
MKIDRTTLRDRCRLAAAGIDKYLATEPTLPIDGAAITPADLKKSLQKQIDAADSTQAARAAWLSASAAEAALHDATVSTLSFLRSFVALKFGSKNEATLADFGFTPRTRKVPSAETKAAAAEKAAATRAARHTMGKRQKAKIKGTVAPSAPAHATPGVATATRPAPAAQPAPAEAPRASVVRGPS